MTRPVLLWLRRDLRLADQPALAAAVATGAPVIPVYVLDDEAPGDRRMGGASRWWLHHSLASLDSALRQRGSRLILRRGASDRVFADLARETGAREVFALHHYDPWRRHAGRGVARLMVLRLYDGNYLAPPGSVLNGSGKPYRIFTPFWHALNERMPPARPQPAPEHIPAPDAWPASEALASWDLLPTRPDWARGFAGEWTPGEDGANARLDDFLARVGQYDATRNLPSTEGTSRLSPHLHFGEIGPATVWWAVSDGLGHLPGAATFLSELGWRDYAQNLIVQFPEYGEKNGHPRFDALPWRSGEEAQRDLKAWQRGMTGYPIIDAGMRQLWATGWMHNRVRMLVASFLTKHLLIDWREGESWFWDTLVDADYAQNATNWQWSAGTGVDANQFTRIMAPLSQSEKFDAAAYIRQWVPELAKLPDSEIHDPTDRPQGYPEPIVQHAEARARALAAYATIKT